MSHAVMLGVVTAAVVIAAPSVLGSAHFATGSLAPGGWALLDLAETTGASGFVGTVFVNATTASEGTVLATSPFNSLSPFSPIAHVAPNSTFHASWYLDAHASPLRILVASTASSDYAIDLVPAAGTIIVIDGTLEGAGAALAMGSSPPGSIPPATSYASSARAPNALVGYFVATAVERRVEQVGISDVFVDSSSSSTHCQILAASPSVGPGLIGPTTDFGVKVEQGMTGAGDDRVDMVSNGAPGSSAVALAIVPIPLGGHSFTAWESPGPGLTVFGGKISCGTA